MGGSLVVLRDCLIALATATAITLSEMLLIWRFIR
jgi:hypothetical protein